MGNNTIINAKDKIAALNAKFKYQAENYSAINT